MKSEQSPLYQYIKIDNYFFCLQQSPLVFAWLIFCKRENLITAQPWLKKTFSPWTVTYFRYHANIIRRNILHLIFFVRCRLGLKKNIQMVQLPVYGQFGMAVHQGYKIFNIRCRVVTKIFDPDVNSTSIVHEIEQLKKASQIDFAPSLINWDMAERWYQEEYIRSKIPAAHRSADSDTLLRAFYQEAMPCLNSLMLSQSPTTKELMEYIRELTGMPAVRKLLTELTGSEGKTIREFLDSMVESLRPQENLPVYLVFSHGDFCPANILETKQGMKLIDWEGARYRSALFDFYSYFFYRSGSRNIPVSTLLSEVQTALPLIIEELAKNTQSVAGSVKQGENLYRWTFYIEMVCRLIERETSDKNLNILSDLARYLEAFNSYEALLSGKSQSQPRIS